MRLCWATARSWGNEVILPRGGGSSFSLGVLPGGHVGTPSQSDIVQQKPSWSTTLYISSEDVLFPRQGRSYLFLHPSTCISLTFLYCFVVTLFFFLPFRSP